MSAYAPPHNLNALLIGTGEFSFSLGATTPAVAAQLGFRDFGNIKAFQVDASGEDKEHFGTYRGTTRRDDIRKQKIKLGYKLTNDEWTTNTLRFLFFGAVGAAITRAAIAAVAGTAIPFTNATPSSSLLYYDLLDAGGHRVRELTAVTFPGLVENTDFTVDYKVGRVQFQTQQVANVTPTITAAAINTGTPTSLSSLTPLQTNVFAGIGRLICFDEDTAQQIVFEHTDFTCQVEISGTPDVKSDDYSDLSLMVSVTGLVGTVYSREL